MNLRTGMVSLCPLACQLLTWRNVGKIIENHHFQIKASYSILGETRVAKRNMQYCESLDNFRSLWQKSCLSELLITSIGAVKLILYAKKSMQKDTRLLLVLHLESLFRYSKTYWSEKEKKDQWNSCSLNDVGHCQTKRERLTCTAWPGTRNTPQNDPKTTNLGMHWQKPLSGFGPKHGPSLLAKNPYINPHHWLQKESISFTTSHTICTLKTKHDPPENQHIHPTWDMLVPREATFVPATCIELHELWRKPCGLTGATRFVARCLSRLALTPSKCLVHIAFVT